MRFRCFDFGLGTVRNQTPTSTGTLVPCINFNVCAPAPSGSHVQLPSAEGPVRLWAFADRDATHCIAGLQGPKGDAGAAGAKGDKGDAGAVGMLS
eukprot:2739052-Rhodomonas_salina.1